MIQNLIIRNTFNRISVILFSVIFIMSVVACDHIDEATELAVREAGQLSDELERSAEILGDADVVFADAPPITFSGKVVNNQTGEWPNDHLILVFLNGKEVGRGTTHLGEFVESGEGIHDGLFKIQVPNIYELASNNQIIIDNETAFFSRGDEVLGSIPYLYYWLPNIEVDELLNIEIPDKNTYYSIKVVPGTISTLPSEILESGSTELTEDNRIIVSLPDEIHEDTTYGASSALQGVRYKIETEEIEVNKFTTPLNNCAGSATVSQEFTQAQTFIHEYYTELSAGINIPIHSILDVELQGKYGFKQGETNTKTVSYFMEALPGTHQVYVVTWSEIWEQGIAEVASNDTTVEVPFRIKTDLIYAVDSESIDCK